jgi:hypothetical protein
MKKSERKEHVLKRAEELARSGDFTDWILIEHKLRSEGFPEARQLIDDRHIRSELTRMCAEAKKS